MDPLFYQLHPGNKCMELKIIETFLMFLQQHSIQLYMFREVIFPDNCAYLILLVSSNCILLPYRNDL